MERIFLPSNINCLAFSVYLSLRFCRFQSVAQHGQDVEFSVGFTMGAGVQDAILRLPESAWTPAVGADGDGPDGADLAELA